MNLSPQMCLYYVKLNKSTVQNSTEQYSTVQSSTVQYSPVQYSTEQYSTVQNSTGHHKKIRMSDHIFDLNSNYKNDIS